jgi:hypothetical protein
MEHLKWKILKQLGFGPLHEQDIFLYFIVSRQTQGPTHLPINWALGPLSPGDKAAGV